MCRSLLIFGMMLISSLFTGTSQAAQIPASPEATPVYGPVANGVQESVARYFSAVSDDASGVIYVEARIADFENTEQAEAAIPAWFQQVATQSYDRYTIEMSPVGVERVADGAQLMIGSATFKTDDDYVFNIMALAVNDGNLLYSFVMWSTYDVGESEIVELAQRTLGVSPLQYDPVPGIAYKTGGLWDALPRIEHMPQGLTWDSDIPPCVGVFGINACPEV